MMTRSGVPLVSTACRFGMASVKPRRTKNPRTAEITTDEMMERGTRRYAPLVSSERSAAHSKPMRVYAPINRETARPLNPVWMGAPLADSPTFEPR